MNTRELRDKKNKLLKENIILRKGDLDVCFDKEKKQEKNKINNIKNDNYIVNIDTVESLIEDLLSEIEHLNEKYKDLEQDIEDNYRPIPYEEQVCVSDRDFI